MWKVLKIAKREYLAAVKTKGFIIGLFVAPLLMSGGVLVMVLAGDRVDTTDRMLAIIDHSGILAPAIAQAVEERNASRVYDSQNGRKLRPAYLVEIVEPDNNSPQAQRLALSERIRDGDLHAFVEIGSAVLNPSDDADASHVLFYGENAALDEARRWIEQPINQYLRTQRLLEAGVDESKIDDLFNWVPVAGLGLVSVDPKTGTIEEAERSSETVAILVPVAIIALMFILVMMGAVPLINSVMEEKNQKIAEVILGSVRPFEFMMGKVLGGVAISMTGSAIYVLFGIAALTKSGRPEFVPYEILPWFFGYTFLSIVMLGAVYAGLGSACNDVKEAQSVTMPAMTPVMIPLFVMVPVLREPTSSFATWLSLFPPFTPLLMLLRMSTPGGVPSWQPWLGLFGILVFSAFCVWVSGRIFRVGILLQGQPLRFSNLFRWAAHD
jgi:ABC-2 type transport system permease protein